MGERTKEESLYIVKPVAKAAEVLAYVVAQPNRVTLSGVVHALHIPKTTVFRYLQTLAEAGLIDYAAASDTYGAGERFRTLGEEERVFSQLRQSSAAAIETLAHDFAETVNLAVLLKGEIVYVDIREPRRAQRFEARIGGRHPIHSTSLGKAIASGLSDQAIDEILRTEMAPRTTRTITDVRSFRRQIEQARQLGYAIDAGENEEGVVCIGVPIPRPAGGAIAAISLSAPHHRMEHIKERAILSLRAAAVRISEAMERSYRP